MQPQPQGKLRPVLMTAVSASQGPAAAGLPESDMEVSMGTKYIKYLLQVRPFL
jgi:hypothetical protein